MVNGMRDITSRVFEHLEITYPMNVHQFIAYMQRILRGYALKKYKAFLLECKQLGKDLVGDKWTLGDLKGISMDDLCNWD